VPFGQDKYKLLSKSEADVYKLDYTELIKPLLGEEELWGEDGSGMGCLCEVSHGNVEGEAPKDPDVGDFSPRSYTGETNTVLK